MTRCGLGNLGILIEEIDGSPSGFCTKLKVTNASLTNNGDGSFSLVCGGVSDHGILTGLSDDDHSQYLLLAGRVGGQSITGDLTLQNTALHILDTNASHDLIIAPGSDLSADRTFTIMTGDADRTITLNGDVTLNDWFDQAVKSSSNPSFGGLTMNGDLDLTKIGTADAGTQYNSRDFTLTSSVWDTDNLQAEDRIIIIRNVGGSGANGAESYYLSIIDNSSSEIFRIDPVSSKVFIPTSGKIGPLTDVDSEIDFSTADQMTITIGNQGMIQLTEGGLAGLVKFNSGSGWSHIKTFAQNLVDDASTTLQATSYAGFGWLMATSGPGVAIEEVALFMLDGVGNVTLLSSSSDVVANADTDGKFCIGTSASQKPLSIKNRLGGARAIIGWFSGY